MDFGSRWDKSDPLIAITTPFASRTPATPKPTDGYLPKTSAGFRLLPPISHLIILTSPFRVPFSPSSVIFLPHTLSSMASSSSDLGHARPEDDELASLDELYNINVVPSELFFKFRKQIEGFRVGANLEVLTCFSPRSFSVFC